MDSVSYALGADIARHYIDLGLELNPDLLYQGFQDKYKNIPLKLQEEEIENILDYYASQFGAEGSENLQALSQENQVIQEDFLKKNQEDDEVNTLASGLQYRIISEGDGNPPQIDNLVQVDYEGRLLNGEVFTPKGVRELQLSEMIPGLQEALTLMKPGDHWELFVPSDLAYGEDARFEVPPNSLLIFDLKVLQIL
ncbi:MAG: FKBP-type peptidyl-prolyl cis-trans isomerase N-terminal domain-containing protein [Bacteroidota bacterium]